MTDNAKEPNCGLELGINSTFKTFQWNRVQRGLETDMPYLEISIFMFLANRRSLQNNK